MLNQNLLLTGDDGYNLTNSLRFRASATAYLNRTPASSGSTTTWTISAWVKRGLLSGSASYRVFSGGTGSTTYGTPINFINDTIDWLEFNGGSVVGRLTTTQVFRDPSAWYHIVCVWDSTNATSTNRMRMYVNGVQVTALSTATYPSSSASSITNNASSLYLGVINAGGLSQYFDGYLAEVNFIDGQALTPSSFGSTNASTGVWQPAKYTGTYGTNGFYLPFTDNSALTTSSNVGLGKDFSGNGNYWTTNNISITAGSTYDSMTDVPTLTSTTAANTCTWNPAIRPYPSNTDVITNGNLTFSSSFASVSGSAWGTSVLTSGKWYFEATLTTAGPSNNCVGFSNNTVVAGQGTYTADARTWGWFYQSSGQKTINSTITSYGSSYTTGDVIGIALDIDNLTITFYKNNVSQGQLTGLSLASGSAGWLPAVEGFNGTVWNSNFGQQPFVYTPPTGFVALNTYNLPTSTIVAGNLYMNATLWSGDSTSSRSIANTVNGVSFQPDFVWLKNRTTSGYSHQLTNSVVGAPAMLQSDTTNAQATSDANGLQSAFTSTGFTLSNGGGNVNLSGQNYVAWQWKANGTAVTNTAGTISSQVSANTSAGFSVVTYTGNATNGATVGHGLGVAPRMIIVKNRSTSTLWSVYHASVGAASVAHLNDTAAFSASGDWNSTTPTSTVFTVGTSNRVNNADNYVAYCFAEIAGYSAFGSYTGNGSTDGTFVYLGFRPRFVLFKNITQASQWILLDTARNTYNVANAYLEPNTSDSENTASTVFDMLSNGFKLRNSGGTDFNENANNYIYMAFSENPFKNSLAR